MPQRRGSNETMEMPSWEKMRARRSKPYQPIHSLEARILHYTRSLNSTIPVCYQVNDEDALDNEIPHRRMTIHRHLGTDKVLEGPHDVIVKDIEKLKYEMAWMKVQVEHVEHFETLMETQAIVIDLWSMAFSITPEDLASSR
ncbi:hypothetical protein QYF36_022667 [Acer negundo]|nr:hypothetical protein QYF36_022667 [Acer negundo]